MSRLAVDASDGAVLGAHWLTADAAEVDLLDGAVAEICVAGSVAGKVSDGAVLGVSCGGNAGGVRVSEGGVVKDGRAGGRCATR